MRSSCTSCHGNPPATGTTHHPANANCGSCHTGYSSTTVTAATHVDGTVQKPAAGCTALPRRPRRTGRRCRGEHEPHVGSRLQRQRGRHDRQHGRDLRRRRRPRRPTSPERAGAPPRSPAASATPFPHRATSPTRRVSAPAAPAPPSPSAALARTGGITTAAYAGSTTATGANGAGTCSNVYCHGNFKNGAHDGRPVLARRRRRRQLRLLPRPASRRNPPGQRGLRDLPHRLHRHHRQRGRPRERHRRRRRTSPAPPATGRRRA